MFKVGDRVKRNPRIWKNDPTVFTVVALQGALFVVQRPGKERNPFTGKMTPHQPMPYQRNELVPA